MAKDNVLTHRAQTTDQLSPERLDPHILWPEATSDLAKFELDPVSRPRLIQRP